MLQHNDGIELVCAYALLKSAQSRPPIERNPSAIKQMLLDWCKSQCQGYEVHCSYHWLECI